jgi:hypothetical protein
LPVGHITLGTGHANLTAKASDAAAHYDNTGSCVADVRVGEDEYGIWVAGAARPDADLDVLRAASLSGDWRRVNGELELVAALAVNVPGFPIPRTQTAVAASAQIALVAAGIPEQDPIVAKSTEELLLDAVTLLNENVSKLIPPSMEEPEPPEEIIPEPSETTTSGHLARLFGT